MSQDVVRFESLFSAPVSLSASHEEPPQDVTAPPPTEKDSYQELERKYRHRTYQAQELMIERLLRSHVSRTGVLERKLSMFDLHFDHANYMVVLVRPGSDGMGFLDYASDIRDGGQIGLIVSSIFSELLGEHYSCYPANLDDRYAFLLNFDESDSAVVSSAVAEICRYAVKFIKTNFSLELNVCVSGMCIGLNPLHDMFRETDMVANDENTRYVDHVCVRAEGGHNNGPHNLEPSIEKQYLNALVTQDYRAALSLTLERAQAIYMERGTPDLERVKMFLNMRMRTTSSVLATPINDIQYAGHNLGEECMLLDGCNTIAEMEPILTTIFNGLDAHFNAVPSDYTGTTGKVISLIGKKYMEPDLSVEMICDTLGKSRSYLSRMFKENTGMNLLDYLHTTRLTHAKRLLNETDLGISEIASKVGYYSGWTLARVFKRYEGITPTAYRKAFCHSDTQ